MDSKWEFLIPNQVKITQPNGTLTTSYSFPITKSPPYSEVLTGTVNQLTNGIFTPAVINSYLLDLYNAFLRIHSHRFAKNYTPAQLIKVTRHVYSNIDMTNMGDEEFNFTLNPSKIDIISNSFVIDWKVIAESQKIELIEEDDTEIEEVDVTNYATEANVDFLRRESSGKEEYVKTVSNGRQSEALKQLEQARLKSLIAKLKAERAIEKYVLRYGPIDPALLDSDSDNDNS